MVNFRYRKLPVENWLPCALLLFRGCCRLSQSPFWNTDFSSLLRAFFDRPILWSGVGRGVIGGVSLF